MTIDRSIAGHDEILDGTGIRCRGCGRDGGVTCVVLDEDFVYVAPTFPFSPDDCPVCVLRSQVSRTTLDRVVWLIDSAASRLKGRDAHAVLEARRLLREIVSTRA